MSGETTILCEGLLKGNVDLEEQHQQALRKALLERENRLLFPQSFAKNALTAFANKSPKTHDVRSA